jgi:DnaJ-class molecular chaperone
MSRNYFVETVLNDASEDVEIHVPFEWVICDYCRGNGTHSKHLGAFTASEWDEQGFEFQEDYLAGNYDKTCEVCNGTGKVRSPRWEVMNEDERRWLQESYDANAQWKQEQEAERRMLGGE